MLGILSTLHTLCQSLNPHSCLENGYQRYLHNSPRVSYPGGRAGHECSCLTPEPASLTINLQIFLFLIGGNNKPRFYLTHFNKTVIIKHCAGEMDKHLQMELSPKKVL